MLYALMLTSSQAESPLFSQLCSIPFFASNAGNARATRLDYTQMKICLGSAIKNSPTLDTRQTFSELQAGQ
jgi:hypothetical protein